MAIRFYLTNSAAPISPAFSTTWETSTGAVRGALATTKAGANTSAAIAETDLSATWDVGVGQWTSSPVLSAGNLSGTFTLTVARFESDAAANLVTRVVIRVLSGDGLTVRGTAIDLTGSGEWPTAVTAGAFTNQALTSSVACQVGDRIVVEYGYRATNTVATSYTGTVYYGGTDATDLVSGNVTTNATTRSPWIEFADASPLFVAGGTPFMQGSLTGARLRVDAAFGADLAAASTTWTWTDITADVQQADGPISITVGRGEEAGVSQPAQCEIQLDNRTGDYSIGGQSANWPYIRRNTPIRVQVDPGTGTYVTRFLGFADAWQPSWDITGRKAIVSLSASGTLRRLQQNTSPVVSAMRRAIGARADVVAYWPCEEGKDARAISSGLTGGAAMVIDGDAEAPWPKFAANDSFVSSLPLPEVDATTWRGAVPSHTDTGSWQVRWLMAAPNLPHGTESILFTIWNTGTLSKWFVTYENVGGGVLHVWTLSRVDGSVYSMGSADFNVNDTVRQYGLAVAQSGTNVTWVLRTLAIGRTTGGQTSGTTGGQTSGQPTLVEVAEGGPNGRVTDTAIGHVYVANSAASMYDEIDELNAFGGETATARLTRLCTENGTSITIVGTSDIKMGPQGVDDLVTLLRQCETADQGILYDGLGHLTYITGSERTNQAADLTLSVTSGHLVDELTPVDDDSRNINTVKAERINGADATYEDTTGTLGTAAVGIYDDSIKVNCQFDDDVIDYATWLTHLGTIDGYRYPTLNINLAKTPSLVTAWLATSLSARVDVTGISTVREQHPGGTATLLLEGYTETLDQHQWTVQLNCSPFEPWRIGKYAADSAYTDEYVLRAVSDGSTLASSALLGATSLSVATPAGPLWTTAADDFPLSIDVGGIQVTVTAISGTTSPQTFTVTATSKALPSALAVELWQPTVLGL